MFNTFDIVWTEMCKQPFLTILQVLRTLHIQKLTTEENNMYNIRRELVGTVRYVQETSLWCIKTVAALRKTASKVG